jgi:hypothetical protein
MSDLTSIGDIPSPETFAKKSLVRAPRWLQRFTGNGLSVLAWVGLPTTILSSLSNLKTVLDGATWLYAHAGLLQPALAFFGRAFTFVVSIWRAVTHPVWQALSVWLHIALPAWAPDVLTLTALVVMGVMRRMLRVAWGDTISGGMMFKGARPDYGRPEDKIAIPRIFPYEQHFAECDVKWTPAKLRDAHWLWRRWRRDQIRSQLAYDGRYWPKFDQDVIRAQFGRYWLSITEGRRDMLMYALAAGVVLLALVVDWSLRTH